MLPQNPLRGRLLFALLSFILLNSPLSAQDDCCGPNSGNRLKTIHIKYTGHLCSSMAGSNHSQTSGVVCVDYYPTLPMPDTVNIIAHDAQGSQVDIIWFDENVIKNQVFVVSGLNHPDVTANDNKKVIGPALELLVYNKAGDSLYQKIEFHTSCSQPIAPGNQFGSALLTYLQFKNNFECGNINEGLLDFGDAPNEDPYSYPTTEAENGAAHNLAFPGPFFGANPPDQDDNGKPDLEATGDDFLGLEDDEDGVASSLVFLEGDDAKVTLTYSNDSNLPAHISAWLDLEGDGFDMDDKQMIQVTANSGGSVMLNFGVVPANNLGETFLRIRISTDMSSIQAPTGISPNGEIEDHFVDIQQPLLAVELADFSAVRHADQVELRWTTLSESNNDHFEVQRSYDALNYENIGRVKGAGSTNIPTHYKIMDQNPGAKKLFYRLNQVDLDGTSTMSQIIQISFEKENPDFILYPNPATDRIFISTGQLTDETIAVEFLNLLGQRVLYHNFANSSDHGPLREISVEQLQPGIYFVKVTDSNREKVVRRLQLQ